MISNSPTRWGSLAQSLHWASAVLILFLIAHGAWMVRFAPREARFDQYALHASWGYALLAVMVIRLLWRWAGTVPALPSSMPRLERIAAQIAHWGLYLLILAAALTGWALAGTFRRPLDSSFGLMRVPRLVSGSDRTLHETLESTHSVVSWVLAGLIVIHIVAALFHWLVRRDDVMQRMWPFAARRASDAA